MLPSYARRRPRTRALLAAAAVAAGTLAGTAAAATSATSAASGALPQLRVSGTYVTGISSGGYMATQLQVAHSARFRGAGIYSAGPYACAQNSVVIALQACTADTAPTQLPALIAQTDRWAAEGKIDPTANLAQQRTWAFHGTRDTTVVASVADDLAAFYRHYGTPLTYRDAVPAGHGWVSPAGPVPCGQTAPPYVNTCDPDPLQDMLGTMLGGLKPPNTGAPKGTVTSVDQDRYAVPAAPGAGDVTRTGGPAIGMGSTGYLYTPRSCANGASCRVVVALHGCQQTAEQIGTTFVSRSYLNPYADTNGFAVLYPQARPDPAFGNPKGCWDWWGYLGAADGDHATQRGPQMRTVMNMVGALGG